MRDYVRPLLAPAARKNSWQLAEQAGHTTPDGLQHLLAGAKWNPDTWTICGMTELSCNGGA